jgi:HEAT repeat protein
MVFGLAFAQDSPINGLSSKFTLMERQMAKDKLIDMGVNAVPLLIQGMKYSDENIKIECIRLLGEIKAKDAVPNLV